MSSVVRRRRIEAAEVGLSLPGQAQQCPRRGDHRVRRRDLLVLVAGAAAALGPLAARAQQKTMPVIGFLGASTPPAMSDWVGAFVRRLHERGWSEGRNIAIEYRWAEGRTERYAEIAAEFVQLKVDVIVTYGTA